ncbi:hypothetical protein M9H77_02925 [Catharanthus roseus]|uniref:Uncharacterized protein n=1 Tax=Catharanthus roseus TaxID=4058 RepID=A0ACC0C9S1_CATRO|nr:hypothetical protein M9H77_02925 [Catharanthus roseus]
MVMEAMVRMLTEEATIEIDIPPIGVKWVVVTPLLMLKLLIISLMKIFVRIALMMFIKDHGSHAYKDQNCGREIKHEGLNGENGYASVKKSNYFIPSARC